MDVGTGLTILGSAIGGKEILLKILGPTADFLGESAKDWSQRSLKNLEGIFSDAKAKLGSSIEQPGAVPPRVLKEILLEGRFLDVELDRKYFGGVLASSRSTVSRDDRGAAWAKIVGGLTSYQIRTHYIVYASIKRLFDGSNYGLQSVSLRKKCAVFIPDYAYQRAMDFGAQEDQTILQPHSLFGLYEAGLIGPFQAGGPALFQQEYPKVKEPGISIVPSASGVELFLWACGYGSSQFSAYLDSNTKVDIDKAVPIDNAVVPLVSLTGLSKGTPGKPAARSAVGAKRPATANRINQLASCNFVKFLNSRRKVSLVQLSNAISSATDIPDFIARLHRNSFRREALKAVENLLRNNIKAQNDFNEARAILEVSPLNFANPETDR